MPRAVVSPPYPCGPMPRRLARSSSSRSSASRMESGLGEPSSRNSAFFERMAACSKVPPTPTPAMSGGQASGPAVLMHSSTQAFTPVHALRGREHLVLGPVLAAAALGHDLDPHRLPRHQRDVDDARRVVAGIDAVEGGPDDRRAQVAFGVAGTDARVDGVGEEPAGHVDVLPHLREAHHEARILAVGNALVAGEGGVVLQDLEHLPPGGRALRPQRAVEGPEHVGLELVVGVHAELLHRVGDRRDVEGTHGRGGGLLELQLVDELAHRRRRLVEGGLLLGGELDLDDLLDARAAELDRHAHVKALGPVLAVEIGGARAGSSSCP